jgi:hypothetical protein
MLSRMATTVEEVPKFWSLIFWFPLSVTRPVTENPLLCAGTFFVPPRAPESHIKSMCTQRLEQHRRLELVSTGTQTVRIRKSSLGNFLRNRSYNEVKPKGVCDFVPVMDCFLEVVSRVDVQQRKRRLCGIECLSQQVQKDDRVLASAEQEDWAF